MDPDNPKFLQYQINKLDKKLTKRQFSGDWFCDLCWLANSDLVLSGHTDQVVVTLHQFTQRTLELAGGYALPGRPVLLGHIFLFDDVVRYGGATVRFRSLPFDIDVSLIY